MPHIDLSYKRRTTNTIKRQRSRDIYQTKLWRVLRAKKFSNNPLCELCLAKGTVTATAEVHHMVPIEVAPHLAFDYANLQSLCVSCHKEEDRKCRILYSGFYK